MHICYLGNTQGLVLVKLFFFFFSEITSRHVRITPRKTSAGTEQYIIRLGIQFPLSFCDPLLLRFEVSCQMRISHKTVSSSLCMQLIEKSKRW